MLHRAHELCCARQRRGCCQPDRCRKVPCARSSSHRYPRLHLSQRWFRPLRRLRLERPRLRCRQSRRSLAHPSHRWLSRRSPAHPSHRSLVHPSHRWSCRHLPVRPSRRRLCRRSPCPSPRQLNRACTAGARSSGASCTARASEAATPSSACTLTAASRRWRAACPGTSSRGRSSVVPAGRAATQNGRHCNNRQREL